MATVHLVCFGAVGAETIRAISQGITTYIGWNTRVHPESMDLDPAFDSERNQYNSTDLLSRLDHLSVSPGDRILGITEADLFIPILTFVFGEALLNRPPAIISLHRLHLSFYGLPEDPELLLHRAQTEAVHELGHTFGLIHCAEYACVMSASRVADEIDLKGPGFCTECADLLSRTLQHFKTRN